MISDLSKLLSFVLRWTRRARHARMVMALVILTSLISGLANTGLLALISRVLSRRGLVEPWTVIAFAALCCALPLNRFLSGALLLRLAAGAVYELRMRLCRGLVSVPLRRLEEQGAHRALAVLTGDIGAVTDAITSFPTLCMQLFILLGSLLYLGWLSWQVLLGLIGFMAIGLISYRFPVRSAMGHLRQTRRILDELLRHFRAATEGGKELRLHRARREAFLADQLEPTALSARRSTVTANTIFIGATSWGQILFFVLIGLVLFGLPALGSQKVEVVLGYSIVVLYMMTPLESIMNTLPILSRATVAVEAIERMGLLLADAPQESTADAPAAVPRAGWERLDLIHVTHTYRRDGEAGSFELGPIDLTFHPGEVVFLIGGNGSGKTTLAKLITGLYAPEGGEIRLDGRAVVGDSGRDGLRQHFSAVFSDFYLFESLLGLRTEGLDERAREQLSLLKLSHKVEVRDGAFSTLDLSQGQRKRLALLTACLEDRPFYVFDEWAADQDPVFKDTFYLQILPSLRAEGKTVLVISHDDRYYAVADRLIKLEYGKVQFERCGAAAKSEIERQLVLT